MSTTASTSPPRAARGILIAVCSAAVLSLSVVVMGLSGGASDFWGGYASAVARVEADPWWSLWAMPGVLLALVTVLAITIATRPVPAGAATHRPRRQAFLWSGVGVLVLAVCSPLSVIAQGGLLTAHMVQHVLIGALAPILILLAIPRAPRGPRRRRRVLAVVLHPVPAFLIWLASTILWLVPDVHHEVLTLPALWIAQQVAVFVAGVILWASITDRIVDPPAWFRTGPKCGYMLGVWFVGVAIANIYWFSGSPLYDSHAAGAAAWGVSPLQDQANAGTVMILAHCAITFVAIGVLFFQNAAERGLEQRLIEAGVPEEQVRRATGEGELSSLAERSGVAIHTRTGLD